MYNSTFSLPLSPLIKELQTSVIVSIYTGLYPDHELLPDQQLQVILEELDKHQTSVAYQSLLQGYLVYPFLKSAANLSSPPSGLSEVSYP